MTGPLAAPFFMPWYAAALVVRESLPESSYTPPPHSTLHTACTMQQRAAHARQDVSLPGHAVQGRSARLKPLLS